MSHFVARLEDQHGDLHWTGLVETGDAYMAGNPNDPLDIAFEDMDAETMQRRGIPAGCTMKLYGPIELDAPFAERAA